MAQELQMRRGTSAMLDNSAGAFAEVMVDTQTKELRAFDGVTPGGFKVGRKAEPTLDGLLTSAEGPRGEGALWQGGRHNFVEVSTGEHLTTPGLAKLQYLPDQDEVNVMALKSSSDGGDISLTLRRAASLFPGKLLRLPPVGFHTAASVFEVGDLSAAHIVAQGANIVVEENVTLFRSERPVWEEVQAAAAIAANNYWGVRKTWTVTDGTAYAVGDTLKIVADDKMLGTRAASGDLDYRMGYIAKVVSISGNDLTMDRPIPIEWAFSTNVRVARLRRRRYSWRGGLIGYEAGHDPDLWTANAMIMYGVTDLDIDVEFELAYNATCRPVGCLQPRIRVVGRDLENDQANLQYGYLVGDSSQGADVTVIGGRNRHGYTTGQPAIEADDDDLNAYGAQCFARVTGQVHGNTQAGFDTHHGSYGNKFYDCYVSGGTDGGGQYVARGIGHSFDNCIGVNGKNGLYVYTEAGALETRDIRATNCQMDVDDKAVRADGAIVELHGGSYRVRKYGNAFGVSNGGRIDFRGQVSLTPGGPADVDSRRMIELDNGTIDARGADLLVNLYYIPNTAANYGIVELGGDTQSTLRGGTWRIINDDYLSTFLYNDGGAGVHQAGGAGFKIITESDGANPNSTMTITGANGAGFSKRWEWFSEEGGGNSGYIYSNINAAGAAPNWYNRGDDIVVWAIFSAGTFDLGAMPDGTFIGQKMMVVCSGGTLTLKTGSATYNMVLGADIPLTAGDGVTLVWNGNVWLLCAV